MTLWCGGEDIDFVDAVTVFAGLCRSNARCGLSSAMSGMAKSKPFPGGAISSGWLSCRVYNPNFVYDYPASFAGLANASQNRGLFVGSSAADPAKAALRKLDGTVATELAVEAGSSLPVTAGTVTKFDLEIVSIGASGVANVYVEGSEIINYSGDLSWLDAPDCVGIKGGANYGQTSEWIVSDTDTRILLVATGYVSGAGDSNAWDGTYADVDEITLSDADVLSTNGTGNDVLLALANLPAGSYSVKAVREVARVAKSASGTATQISLGIKSGGTVDVDSAHSLDTAFASIDRFMTINPVTGVKFTQSEINALQLVMRSA